MLACVLIMIRPDRVLQMRGSIKGGQERGDHKQRDELKKRSPDESSGFTFIRE